MTARNRDQRTAARRYACKPEVAWVVEDDGILLVNRATGTTRFLGYPEAAVWDLLSRGRSFARAVSTLRATTERDAAEAERLVRDCIRQWVDAGILTEASDHG